MNNEEFVKKWVEAYKKKENQSWIAKEFQLSRQAISSKAQYLRKKGVKLPQLSATPNPRLIDIDALNAIIEED